MAADARYSQKEWHAKCQEIFRAKTRWTDINKLIESTMAAAIDGDADARRLIWPYLFGAKPSQPLIEITNNDNRQQAVVWGIAWKPPESLSPDPTLAIDSPSSG